MILKFLFYLSFINHTFKFSTANKSLSFDLKDFQHIQMVDYDSLESLKRKDTLSLIHYFTTAEIDSKASFVNAYNASAKYLAEYNINLAMLNCDTNPNVAECKEKFVDRKVMTYQLGVELLTLELDTMFDVNSIMSNALQLLLVREVPIIESQEERKNLQSSYIGKADILYFYSRAIGTFDHRLFMEIAYAYKDQYKFAISTKIGSNFGLQGSESLTSNDRSALWTLHCSKASFETKEGNSCENFLFKGPSTLSSLAEYMKKLGEVNLFHAPENGTSSLFEEGGDLPVVFFYTNTQNKQPHSSLFTTLALQMKGFAKVIVVNVDDKECGLLAQNHGFDGQIPRVALLMPDGSKSSMEYEDPLNLTVIQNFLVTSAVIPTRKVDKSDYDLEKYMLMDDVEFQDDEVATAAFPENQDLNFENSDGTPSVLKATFHSVVESADLKIVLYHLPFDAVSLIVLKYFEEAAQELSSLSSQGLLAKVNCFDATDLCEKENITAYPVIRIHRKNQPFKLYKGHLDTASLVKATRMLMHSFPLVLGSDEEIDKFEAGEFPPKISNLSPSSVMFVARKDYKGIWSRFREASKSLSYVVAMAEVSDTLLNSISQKYQSSVPCVISINHHDKFEPVRILHDISSVEKIVSFVMQSTIATMPELTVANFPTLHAKNVPLVILFLDQLNAGHQNTKAALTNIATLHHSNDYSFCWMNVQNNSIGQDLLMDYTKSSSLPTLVVVDHAMGKVFVQQKVQSLTTEQMTQWFHNVFSNKETSFEMLKKREWTPPGPFYDFLSKIDMEIEEEQNQLNQPNRLSDINSSKGSLQDEEEVRKKLLERSNTHSHEEIKGNENMVNGKDMESSHDHTEL